MAAHPLPLLLYLAATARADRLAQRLLARRLEDGKEDPVRIGERLGKAGLPRPPGPLAWFHAASVGEGLSLLGTIEALLAARPGAHVLVTTGTRSSALLLQRRLPRRATHQFVPVDTAGAVRSFLDHWRPDVAVWTESELWPRLVVETAARRIPMLLVNARMTRRSAERWRRLRSTATALLARFELVLAQDEVAAATFREVGAPSERLRITGTLKAAAAPLEADPVALTAMRRAIGTRPVWLAASTHAGEEALAAAAHERVRAAHPDALLVVVPRHPERGPEAAAAVGGAPRRAAGAAPGPGRAYIADTLGEMGLWFRIAPVAFLGGSTRGVGGHNPFEPVALGCAVIHGPDVQNFAAAYRALDAAGGAAPAAEPAAIAAAVLALFEPGRRAAMLSAAGAALADGGEAQAAVVREVLQRLPVGPPPA